MICREENDEGEMVDSWPPEVYAEGDLSSGDLWLKPLCLGFDSEAALAFKNLMMCFPDVEVRLKSVRNSVDQDSCRLGLCRFRGPLEEGKYFTIDMFPPGLKTLLEDTLPIGMDSFGAPEVHGYGLWSCSVARWSNYWMGLPCVYYLIHGQAFFTIVEASALKQAGSFFRYSPLPRFTFCKLASIPCRFVHKLLLLSSYSYVA